MLKRLMIGGLVLLLAAPLCATGLGGTVIDGVLRSGALGGEDKPYQVYLPPGYESSGIDYSVLYFLHSEQECWADAQDVIEVVDGLVTQALIEPIIVVKFCGLPTPPWNGVEQSDAVAFFADSVLVGAYETYPVVDLVAHIDAAYRTISDRDHRSVMGRSVGAQGAVRFALRHPDVFGAVASSAGMMDWNWLRTRCADVAVEQGNASIDQYDPLAPTTRLMLWLAAHFAVNLDNPPWYVDFPCTEDGQAVGSVWETIDSQSPYTIADELQIRLERLPGSEAVSKERPFDIRVILTAVTDDEYGADVSSKRLADMLRHKGMPNELRLFASDVELRHTEYQMQRAVTFIHPITAEVWVRPTVLTTPIARRLSATIFLPEGVSVDEVASGSVVLSAVAGRELRDPVPELVLRRRAEMPGDLVAVDKSIQPSFDVSFSAAEVAQALVRAGVFNGRYLELTIRGELEDGRFFGGSDWVMFNYAREDQDSSATE